jgi:hypothetical protein
MMAVFRIILNMCREHMNEALSPHLSWSSLALASSASSVSLVASTLYATRLWSNSLSTSHSLSPWGSMQSSALAELRKVPPTGSVPGDQCKAAH